MNPRPSKSLQPVYSLAQPTHRIEALIGVLLALVTLAIHSRAIMSDFVWYDDNDYLLANERVQQGLTWDNIKWAFTTTAVANWHPMTWLSYMLDCTLYGMRPAWHHFTSVLFHAANTFILLVVLNRLTGSFWRSTLVAALFALHPLHVESVAWVAERKDVLSTFFGLLALGAYVRYAQRKALGSYLLVGLLFALSLMSKPMLVTLPCILLLLDYWPLRRMSLTASSIGRSFVEKMPLFAMSAAASLMTIWAQRSSGAMYSLILLPFSQRVINAVVVYVMYLAKTVWPTNLAVLYPHPGSWPAHVVVISIVVLLALTIVSILQRRTRPHLIVGWLWYVGSLVPVIGLVQVGFQSMADRYTYFPLIGIFIMVAWSLPITVNALGRRWLPAMIAMCIAVIAILAGATWSQIQYWRNSETLFRRAIDATEGNFIAHYNLGYVLRAANRNEAAIEQFIKAIEIFEIYAPAHENMGKALSALGRFDEAVVHYRRSIELMPDNAITYNNLGSALAKLGRFDEAAQSIAQSIAIDASNAVVHLNHGETLLYARRYPEALAAYERAAQLDPQSSDARVGMARALAVLNRIEESLQQFDEALRLNPHNEDAAMYRQRVADAWEAMKQK